MIQKKEKNGYRRGFTLMEMLIVVGVISILVSVAIPAYGNSLALAQAKACTDQRSAMRTELIVDILYDKAGAAADFAVLKDNYPCPEGGEYTLDYNEATGMVAIHCSKHSDDGSISARPLRSVDFETIREILTTINPPGNIDSEAPNTRIDGSQTSADKFRDQMKAHGISLDGVGATMWDTQKKSGKLNCIEWTTLDPATLSKGDTVLIIRFSFVYNAFTVWEAKIDEKTGDVSATPYKVLVTQKMISPDNGEKTLDEALEIYANKIPAYPKHPK